MPTRSAGQNPITPYFEPERLIHQTLRKKKMRNPFIPIEDRVPKTKYPPFKKLFEAKVVYNLFLDLPFLMADEQPMWGNNRAVAPTPKATIVAVDLGDNFTIKAHHLSMIKDQHFDGRLRTDPHKHITEFRDRHENRSSNPSEENPPIPRLPERRPNKLEFEKTMREFVIAQKKANDFVKNQFNNLKTKVEQEQKNHQVAIQDLETKFGRIFDHQSSRPPGMLINSSKQDEDPRSFLIPCKLANLVEDLALADLGVSINLMSYSLYVALSGTTLKPTWMSIRLANHTYQFPMGVAKNMLVQVGKFVFLVDFVILQIKEDDRVPLIFGRPFLHTADAIIRVKNKELNLRVGEDRATFHIYKAMRNSHVNDGTCFRMDIIDDITEDELDALLDDSKPFLNTSEKISETSLDKEFNESMSENV
uniref:Reverse transcriptase domain-containing protein n=1 Tax=Tanacetum cinerariifolium TaxID=118510 RepID=A0A6L2JF53_TANCI|nr:reverse transcriptase domain-containing protein [Tanacetum cinerariifolium]